MILCTCEKPSVAKDIAKVLGAKRFNKEGYYEGNGYIVTWAIGHLIGLCYPGDYDERYDKWAMEDLPIIPEVFKKKILPNTRAQFYTIKRLIQRKDIEYIINCGDAGREGEYIQRLIYEAAGNKHKVKRLWLSSFAENEIRNAFLNLLDSSQKDTLYEEAKARSEADWLVGINMSRLFSIRYHTPLSIGRVQTPTLKLIVDRDEKIENFKPEPYYEVDAEFDKGFHAKWIKDGNSKFTDPNNARSIIDRCNHKTGKVTKLETQRKKIHPPFLYSLDLLQKEANQMFGYGAAETLQIAQSLYETHKIVTYPRTDSNYLTSEMKKKLPGLIKGIGLHDKYTNVVSSIIKSGLNITGRMINDKKISDHHAIIVTENIHSFNTAKLNNKEMNILNLIITRMLSAVAGPFQYDETYLAATVENEIFVAKTKRIADTGYRKIEADLLNRKLPDDMKSFTVHEGDQVTIDHMEMLHKATRPPKYFTEGMLIDAMTNIKNLINDKDLKESVKQRGLGTVATRGAIIERLKKIGYITSEKSGKSNVLHATEKGKKLISLIPDSISSPELTAKWEERLAKIEDGSLDPDKFMNDIKKYVSDVVNEYGSVVRSNEFSNTDNEVLGKCPRCGGEIIAGQYGPYCRKRCGFNVAKVYDHQLDKVQIKTLLGGRSIVYSDNGKRIKILPEFTQNEYNGKIYYNWKISTDSLGICPHCGQDVIQGQYGPYCIGRCGANIAKVYGHALTTDQVKALLSGKSITYTEKKKKNMVFPEMVKNEYNGKIYWNWKTKKME